jgi:CheY-like chemotaxis protein
VLAVDDSKIILKMYSRWGKESGLDVVTADDGDVAVSFVKNGGPFDVILMDKEMSRLDGIEAGKIIRSLGFTGILALVSGSVLSDADSQAVNALFDTVLVKGDKRTYQDVILELDQREQESVRTSSFDATSDVAPADTSSISSTSRISSPNTDSTSSVASGPSPVVSRPLPINLQINMDLFLRIYIILGAIVIALVALLFR